METEFAIAAQHWQLEKLYLDLATAKGRGLTPLEKEFLQGLLCGYSPGEIAERVYQGRSTSAVRVYLSNGLYKYLQDLLFTSTGSSEKIKNWSRVTQLLERAGYRKPAQVLSVNVQISGENWEEKRDLSGFLGRESEINRLQEIILVEKCRLLCVSGVIGIGKSLLVTKLAQEMVNEFDWVVWRSLSLPNNCNQLLSNIVKNINPDQDQNISPISSFLNCLRSRRCLIILDQFESVFMPRQESGIYLKEHENYQELLQRLAQETHQSCCLLISREVPKEIVLEAKKSAKIQNFPLQGLAPEAAKQLMERRNLVGIESEGEYLSSFFANNPLMLETISLIIKQHFQGRVTDFPLSLTFGFSEMGELWDDQLERLGEQEKLLLYILVIKQKLLKYREIVPEIPLTFSFPEQLKALASLERRGLVQSEGSSVQISPLLKVYLVQKFLKEVDRELINSPLQGMVQYLLTQIIRE